jgi:hypothetical protein
MGVFLGESLGDGATLGVVAPVEGVVFPNTVFRRRKPGRSRTSDSGVSDVTPFLKASLLKFVSATSSPSTIAFVFQARFACGGGGLLRAPRGG